MTRWTAFAGLTAVVLVLLLALAYASQRLLEEPPDAADATSVDDEGVDDEGVDDEGVAPVDRGRGPFPPLPEPGAVVHTPGEGADDDAPASDPPGLDAGSGAGEPADDARVDDAADGLPPVALFVNVALSQGLLGLVLLGAAWYTEVPPDALGVSAAPLSTGLPAVAVGVGLGLALALANEVGALGADAMGLERSEELRGLLAPRSTAGWVVLLGGVLPVIAGFEELLFRAALVGAMSAGFPVSPWLLAVVSSAAFALGHGAQGTVGVAVTGALGMVLAAAFVLTGSLLVVVVAHYLVNAVEFGLHEGLGVGWRTG